MILCIIFASLLGAYAQLSCDSINTQNWKSSLFQDVFELKWNVNQADGYIQLFLHIRDQVNPKWVGFGLSESGHMLGSDIVSVSFHESKFFVDDRYVNWTATPLSSGPSIFPYLDTQNDWTLICGTASSTELTAVVQRSLDTKDKNDRVIKTGSVPVVYAWGNCTDKIDYHGANRGTASVAFIEDPSELPFPPADATGTIDLLYNPGYVLEGGDTYYLCQSFDLGPDDLQIVAVAPFLNSSSHQVNQMVHHILLHNYGNEITSDYTFNVGMTTPCFARHGLSHDLSGEGNSPLGRSQNQGLISAWALGGGPLLFPLEAGFTIGANTTRYVILEMHINNPTKNNELLISNVGVKIYTTKVPRKYESASLVVGDVNLQFQPIGYGSNIHYESTCPRQCTQKLASEVKIFASFLHMHNYGRQAWSTIYRFQNTTSNEITSSEIIDGRQFWNNGFQVISQVDHVLYPGDQISSHCVYDTTKINHAVNFAGSSTDEMCMHFLFIYPASAVFNQGQICGISDGGSDTECGSGSNLGIPNPIPDGQFLFPRSLYFGPNDTDMYSTVDISYTTSSISQNTQSSSGGLNVTSYHYLVLFLVLMVSMAVFGALLAYRMFIKPTKPASDHLYNDQQSGIDSQPLLRA